MKTEKETCLLLTYVIKSNPIPEPADDAPKADHESYEQMGI